ncbi:MAG: hypothetical protein EPN70_18535 [Paraburkholderia sp.]|uniref:hypothetical protein n=1 Tax=Paraburkholderia sp. TaxID=1926495 RepID=UPI0011FE222E|nr:hypothetical protein [Paraburkholderia sp.]TAM01845.1 MAG: hypothetical protein EPN70_18535 [Paraburkholderia sp.]
MLTIIDAWNRECPHIEVDISLACIVNRVPCAKALPLVTDQDGRKCQNGSRPSEIFGAMTRTLSAKRQARKFLLRMRTVLAISCLFRQGA